MKEKILFGFFILTLIMTSCSKTEQPDLKYKNQKLSIEQQLFANHQIKIPIFNDPLLTKAQNEISVTPEWNKIKRIHNGKTSVVPLKMSKKVFLKTSKKVYRPLKLKAFMVIKNTIATKSGGDDNAYVVMTDDNEEGSGDEGGTAPGGSPQDIQFVSLSTLNGNLLYAMVFVDSFLEYLIMPPDVPMIDPNFQADTNFNVWLATNDPDGMNLTVVNGPYCIAYKTVTKKHYEEIANWGIVTKDPDKKPIDYEIAPPDDPGGPIDDFFGFQISLNVSPANSGVTIGSGFYPTFIVKTLIKAIPNTGYKFSSWSGDFAGRAQEFEYNDIITQNISATAVFEKIPCVDNLSANPLVNMSILGTINNGIQGGRFGSARGRPHTGIDLFAAVGTPIYATFDGVIVRSVSKYDQDMPWEKYQMTYGKKNMVDYNAGNRVWIKSTINGEIVYQKYFHMDDVFVSEGAEVKAGTIIGIVGTTGSACSPNSNGPHLHYEFHIGFPKNPINPEPYLFTKFNSAGTPIRNCNN